MDGNKIYDDPLNEANEAAVSPDNRANRALEWQRALAKAGAPPGWKPFMMWPPPAKAIHQAASVRNQGQLRFMGRPAFVIDGIALKLVTELTGHSRHSPAMNVDLTDLAEKEREMSNGPR